MNNDRLTGYRRIKRRLGSPRNVATTATWREEAQPRHAAKAAEHSAPVELSTAGSHTVPGMLAFKRFQDRKRSIQLKRLRFGFD